MIKRCFYILILVATLGTVGCQRKNIIPDDTLAAIFHDAFVVNAYVEDVRMNLDSIQIYEPIFNRYGYTSKDVLFTVGNFSRRKSARLGMVVEQAIARLEKENSEYKKRVVILDTIRNVAVRSFTQVVYNDSIIKATKRADSTLLRIEVSPIQFGEYRISYKYKNEDDIEKYPRTSEFYFIDENGHRNSFASVSLRENGMINRTLISRTNNRTLVLDLAKYDRKKEMTESAQKGKKRKKWRAPKTQNIEIQNLRVVYKPKEEAAIDSLFERYVNIKVFADGFLIKKDSVALSIDTEGVSASTTDNR